MTDSRIKTLVREAYVLSDLRFQTLELLLDAFGFDAVARLLGELGGFRIKKSEAVYPGYLSLGPVLKRTLGAEWERVFEVVGADVITLPTVDEKLELEGDVEAYCLVAYPERRVIKDEDKKRATKVRKFLKQAGLEF